VGSLFVVVVLSKVVRPPLLLRRPGRRRKKSRLLRELVFGPFLEIVSGNGKEYPGIKWNLFSLPSKAEAELSGLTFEQYSDFVFNSMLGVNWLSVKEEMQTAKEVIDYAEDVHIYVPSMTDLHLSLRDRGAKLCYGEYNLPDGEFFYGPVEGSLRGFITFPYKTKYDGTLVSNIRLVFGEDGRVKESSAAEGRAFLEEVLCSPGADMPGELGIGCNTGIKRPMTNILFDEKMGGTIHLAMGSSYLKYGLHEGGGKNASDHHWDMICDLRKVYGMADGEIYVDGKLIQKDGKWCF